MIFLHRWPFCIRHHFTFVFVLSVTVIVRFAIESFCAVLFSWLFRDRDCWFYKDHRSFFNFYMFYEYNRLFCRNVFFTLSAAHMAIVTKMTVLSRSAIVVLSNIWWRFCVVTLLFGFFSVAVGFCRRTESDLFLFSLMSRWIKQDLSVVVINLEHITYNILFKNLTLFITFIGWFSDNFNFCCIICLYFGISNFKIYPVYTSSSKYIFPDLNTNNAQFGIFTSFWRLFCSNLSVKCHHRHTIEYDYKKIID